MSLNRVNVMYRIVKFSEECAEEWDDFVLTKSVNGTFLQTRNFLNYHPKGRFIDASLMVYHKNRLIAVIPACELDEEGKILFSHKGSTFGGIIIKKDYYTAEKVIEIIKTVDDYVVEKYKKIILKITSDLFSTDSSDLLQYALSYCGYNNYIELSTYVDLKNMPEDIIESFDRNKMRNILKCEEHALVFRELTLDSEIEAFYNLLEINLSKYGVKPIHTVEEIKNFKYERIPNNVKFYGVFENEVQVAGGMLFVFEQANVIHAQNLSADYHFTEYSPITYLYYRIIKQAKEDGYNYLSWGISTEEQGKILNFGLIRNKESYGSKHQVNRTYYKIFK